jgi:hypothetical protein
MIIVVEVIGILWENGEIGQKNKNKKACQLSYTDY